MVRDCSWIKLIIPKPQSCQYLGMKHGKCLCVSYSHMYTPYCQKGLYCFLTHPKTNSRFSSGLIEDFSSPLSHSSRICVPLCNVLFPCVSVADSDSFFMTYKTKWCWGIWWDDLVQYEKLSGRSWEITMIYQINMMWLPPYNFFSKSMFL